ncbi:MAG: HD domain-containing protein [Myxococcales bacterium]|nr:HD domain-containing protein [Myxococcales bacterium]
MADYLAAADLARPDLRKRLDRVMMAEDAESGLDALLECGALEALLPPVAGLVGFGDGEWRHKDVWKHTKQVVGQATPKLEVRWAALLHDIGKVKTRSISADGQVHFFGHAEVGARMFDKLQKRMALFTPDSALEREIRFLVLHHLRASHYSPSWTDSAVRRFAREMGGYLEDLFCLSRADITTKRAERKRKGTKQIDDLMVRVSALAAEDAERPILPTGLGNALMESFQIPPSKRLGDIKRNVENAVKAGLVLPYLECEDYVAFLREHPALLS